MVSHRTLVHRSTGWYSTDISQSKNNTIYYKCCIPQTPLVTGRYNYYLIFHRHPWSQDNTTYNSVIHRHPWSQDNTLHRQVVLHRLHVTGHYQIHNVCIPQTSSHRTIQQNLFPPKIWLDKNIKEKSQFTINLVHIIHLTINTYKVALFLYFV